MTVAVLVIVDWDSVTVAVVVFVERDEGRTMSAGTGSRRLLLSRQDLPVAPPPLLKPRSGYSDILQGAWETEQAI